MTGWVRRTESNIMVGVGWRLSFLLAGEASHSVVRGEGKGGAHGCLNDAAKHMGGAFPARWF